MESRLKICAVIVGLTLGLSGCAQDLAKLNQDLANLNAALAGKGGSQPGRAQTGGVAMAAQPEAGHSKPIQMIIPNDKRTAAAIDEALPTMKKVLSIHQCVKNSDSLRQMNIYAIPGADMASQMGGNWNFPISGWYMKYHDQNKCLRVSTLDQWAMPALNALKFRAVYFADDSGETFNFYYLFKKSDDGSWKIAWLGRNL